MSGAFPDSGYLNDISVAIATVSAQVIPPNPNRKALFIFNPNANAVTLFLLSSTGTPATVGYPIPAGGSLSFGTGGKVPTNGFNGSVATAAGNLGVWEG